VNNGVYRCGFATSQPAYDAAAADVAAGLRKVPTLPFCARKHVQLLFASFRLYLTRHKLLTGDARSINPLSP
jgi:glutathionyl-hydroquinone reductase